MPVPGMVRIVLTDPPFAYARQMVLSDGSRVPYDANAIAAQQERDRFTSSIQQDSREIVDRAGAARILLADRLDAAHVAGETHLETLYRAMLREAV